MSIVAFPQQGLEGIISSSRYEIIEEVGRGTWGVVYKARDLTFNDIVAIKVLEPTDLWHQSRPLRFWYPQRQPPNTCVLSY